MRRWLRRGVLGCSLSLTMVAGCRIDLLESGPELEDAHPIHWSELVLIPDADAQVRRSTVFDVPKPEPVQTVAAGIETFRFDIRAGPLGDPLIDLTSHTAVATDPAGDGHSILAPGLVTASVFAVGPLARGHVVFVLKPEGEELDAVRVQGECHSAAAYGAMGCFALTDLPPESAALATLMAPIETQEGEGGEASATRPDDGGTSAARSLSGLLVWGSIDVQGSAGLAALGDEVPIVVSIDLPNRLDALAPPNPSPPDPVPPDPEEPTPDQPSPDEPKPEQPEPKPETPEPKPKPQPEPKPKPETPKPEPKPKPKPETPKPEPKPKPEPEKPEP